MAEHWTPWPQKPSANDVRMVCAYLLSSNGEKYVGGLLNAAPPPGVANVAEALVGLAPHFRACGLDTGALRIALQFLGELTWGTVADQSLVEGDLQEIFAALDLLDELDGDASNTSKEPAAPVSHRASVQPRKSIKFEVLKRDSFTCQYCGRRPPDVVLHVDHIDPKARGGSDDILNLITACADCNLGKSDRPLSDTTILAQQVRQAADMSARREQVELLAKWKSGLKHADEQTIAVVKDWWLECIDYQERLTEAGIDQLRRAIKKYGPEEIIESITEATDVYLRRDSYSGKLDHESIITAFRRIIGVARTRQICVEKPYWMRILYIRGIARNRFNLDPKTGADLLAGLDALGRDGVDLDQVEDIAKIAPNLIVFLDRVSALAERTASP